MTVPSDEPVRVPLSELRRCFEGAIPAVIATADAQGTPNITYLSRVCRVDDERIALSNQFFSKTARNLVENPRASVLLVDPITHDEFRLAVTYERTDRRGPVFERLRADLDVTAALSGMQDVFKLRSADIYRVAHCERLANSQAPLPPAELDPARTRQAVQLAELTTRLARCPDLDSLVSATVSGLDELLGYTHSVLLLLDESGNHLYTIGFHGYGVEGVGAELAVGDGFAGVAAARCAPIRVGNLRQIDKYSRSVRESFEHHGMGPGHDIPVPDLPDADSRVAVPAMALGQLVGVLVVESPDPVAFDETDEAVLTVVASVVANAIEAERSGARTAEPARRDEAQAAGARRAGSPLPSTTATPATHVRFFAVDGSTFLDGDYLIKGVAGRILWALLQHNERDGREEFTNKEIRLDPTLELPEFRDNLESRLILLKRRLDERDAPIRIEKTGRGRFRLVVATPLRLDAVAAPEA